jgi:hypothetical protein
MTHGAQILFGISPLHPQHLQSVYFEAPPYYLAELSFGILAPIDLR